MSGLTDEDRFRFDLQGFLVIPSVLSAEQCQSYSDLADEAWPEQPDDGPFRRTEFVTAWGQPFVDLMDHDAVLPCLVELLGQRPRVDHDYCIFMKNGAGGSYLHGGPFKFPDHWYQYRDGKMRNGLTVATWNLTDAPAGAGGFACVPGSHKSNYAKFLPDDVRSFERAADYVYQPPMRAGDVLIFTEALLHGTVEWTMPHDRRTLLYKYSPANSTWHPTPYDPGEFPSASERQKRLMVAPSAYANEPVVQDGQPRSDEDSDEVLSNDRRVP